jgi:hypothetical protein
MSNIISIVPPAAKTADSPTMTQGTVVLLADGTKLEGVTRVELIAETNDVWRARIDCVVHVDRLDGLLAEINAQAFEPSGEFDPTNVIPLPESQDIDADLRQWAEEHKA